MDVGARIDEVDLVGNDRELAHLIIEYDNAVLVDVENEIFAANNKVSRGVSWNSAPVVSNPHCLSRWSRSDWTE